MDFVVLSSLSLSFPTIFLASRSPPPPPPVVLLLLLLLNHASVETQCPPIQTACSMPSSPCEPAARARSCLAHILTHPLHPSQALRLLEARPLHSSQAPTLLKAHNSSFTCQLTTRSHCNYDSSRSHAFSALSPSPPSYRSRPGLRLPSARRFTVHPSSPSTTRHSSTEPSQPIPLSLMLSTLARAVRSRSPACPIPRSHCSSPTCPRSIRLCLLFDSDPLLRCPARCSLLSITWPMLSYLTALLSTALRTLSAQDLHLSCHVCPLLASFVLSPFGPPLSLRLTEGR